MTFALYAEAVVSDTSSLSASTPDSVQRGEAVRESSCAA